MTPSTATTGPSLRPSLAVTLLTVWLVLVMAIPARLQLGNLGTPSILMGAVFGALWLAGTLSTAALPHGRYPMRTALLAFAAMLVIGYVVAVRRILSPTEARAATRTFAAYGAACATGLFVSDALRDRVDLYALVRRLVWGGVGIGLLGSLHALVGIEVVSGLDLPLLTWRQDLAIGIERGSFERVVATASHPIEYGVVLAMVLPFALHLAITDHRGRATWWWAASGLMGSAALFSLSRSAAIGLAVVAVATVLALRSKERQRFVVSLVLCAATVQLVSPGLLRTMRGLFRSLSQDPSYQARVVDYGAVDRYIEGDLWFGRGLGTFVPDEYALLDNQILKLVIEVGLVGVLVFVALIGVGLLVGRTVRRRQPDPVLADLGRTTQVALLVGLLSCLTFDFLAFTMARSVLFVALGIAGATWRLSGLHEPAVAPRPRVTTTIGAAP